MLFFEPNKSISTSSTDSPLSTHTDTTNVHVLPSLSPPNSKKFRDKLTHTTAHANRQHTDTKLNDDVTNTNIDSTHANDVIPAFPSHIDFTASRVAFAIPVGGKTQRLDALNTLVSSLIVGGAGVQNIYVFEDDGSRADQLPSPQLKAICATLDVKLIQTNVKRTFTETRDMFGYHLARHYHTMMDTILRSKQGNTQRSYTATQHAHANTYTLLHLLYCMMCSVTVRVCRWWARLLIHGDHRRRFSVE